MWLSHSSVKKILEYDAVYIGTFSVVKGPATDATDASQP